MATYPDGNPGVWPVDASTPVGQMRYFTGDFQGEEYTPPIGGFRNFASFSDSELQALYDQTGGNLSNATGFAYLKLASTAAAQAISWKSDDLALDLSKSAEALRKIAQMWFDRGDEEDNANGVNDWFDVVPTGTDCDRWGYEFFPGESSFKW